jgi:hypothetical protein
MNTSAVQGLEQQLQDAKATIQRRDRIARLLNNRDFKEIILEGYCKEDCARFTHQSADPSLTKDQQASALDMAQSAGHLKRYLTAAFQMAANAENSLPELEEALEEARGEEVEDAAARNRGDEVDGDQA